MRTVELPGGEVVPALGLGTWHMGERGSDRAAEAAALRAGLDLGLSLIDTAEMYAEGGAEEVVRDAISGRRDEVFIVSKVYPHNASRKGTPLACERSLKRLGTDRIDLYLLHWRGSVPLAETVEAFERLRDAGKIRHWGVSNLDPDDMRELLAVQDGGRCVTDQVLYHVGERGIEWDLLPACRDSGIAVMAYSPLGQGEVLEAPVLGQIASARGVTPAAVALAWVMRQPGVIAIPKSSDVGRTRANAAAADLVLDPAEIAAIDRSFPPPRGPRSLAML
ncbi:MAG: aldo/keto reductase [Hyphomicrobiaceae bacterium]